MIVVNLFNGSTHKLTMEQFNDLKQSIASGSDFFVYEGGFKSIRIKHITEWGVEGDVIPTQDAKLILQNKRRCKYGTVHSLDERCECKSRGLRLPSDIKKQLQAIASGKQVRQLTYEEELKARAEGGEGRAKSIIKNLNN